jgi:hypothetical protein
MHILFPSFCICPEVNAPASRTAEQTTAHGEAGQYGTPRT